MLPSPARGNESRSSAEETKNRGQSRRAWLKHHEAPSPAIPRCLGESSTSSDSAEVEPPPEEIPVPQRTRATPLGSKSPSRLRNSQCRRSARIASVFAGDVLWMPNVSRRCLPLLALKRGYYAMRLTLANMSDYPHLGMEGPAVRGAHGMHARLEDRVQRPRAARNRDALLVDEGMHAIAGVPDRLVQPQRIGVAVGKKRAGASSSSRPPSGWASTDRGSTRSASRSRM